MAKKRYFSRAFSNAKKTKIDGITFDSKLEADKYIHLKVLQKAGKISDLKVQVPFELLTSQEKKPNDIIHSLGKRKKILGFKYITDFTYIRNGQKVALDTKGRTTDVYKLKLKMFLACYPSYQFIEIYRDSKKNNFNIF